MIMLQNALAYAFCNITIKWILYKFESRVSKMSRPGFGIVQSWEGGSFPFAKVSYQCYKVHQRSLSKNNVSRTLFKVEKTLQ